MPYPIPPELEDAIEAGRAISADLFDFYVKDSEGAALTLRCWNWPGTIDYPANDHITSGDVTYEDMHGRIGAEKALRLSASKAAEPLRMTLDGSRSGDDEDFVGRFVDADWHQGRMRLRQITLDSATMLAASAPAWEWHGRLDHRNLTMRKDQPGVWDLTCEGGLFRVRGRRLRTRTHADQQRRSEGDMFYQATALMVGVPLVWAKEQGNVVGAAPPAKSGRISVIGHLFRGNDYRL